MCVFFLPSCCYRRITMEGSSDNAWQNSSSSRDLNASRVSNRNPWSNHDRRFGFLGGSSQDSDLRNERNRVVAEHADEDDLPVGAFVRGVEWGDVSLRQWLDRPDRDVDAFECLHIFSQVVEIVSVAHSEGIVVHNVRPSCFVMSSFNRVSFIESASCSDSGTDSPDDGLNSPALEAKKLTSALHQKQRNVASGMQSSSLYAAQESLMRESAEQRNREQNAQPEEKIQPFPMKQILLMESGWYTSPEEVSGGPSPCASDIYRLGVLLFELFCPFSSREEKSRTMSSLRHRVLPPQLLRQWPKEASFCLWLLHPESNTRPKMGELLQSDFLNEPRDDLEEREAAIELREKIEEQEILLDFLSLVKQKKQEVANKLQHTVSFLCSDIEEVVKHKTNSKGKSSSCPDLVKEYHSASSFPSMNTTGDDDSASKSRKRIRPGVRIQTREECDDSLNGQISESASQDSALLRSSRLMENFKKLESAYFLTRCRPVKHAAKPLNRHSSRSSDGRGSVIATERSSVDNLTSKEQNSEGRRSGWIEPFLEGLCKYLSYSKLKVKADLKQADLLNSSNLVCSLSFDRDREFFATAGVNKKIKIFECDSIINEDRDIHYPVVEIATKSKLSNICWNSYIKGQIASSNFEGVVQVWDVTRSQVLKEMKEHEKRVWSIDFSSADPTMLASGSDDRSVKLWSINQEESIGTIRTKANVCCVQFPLESCRSLAFGSADHKIYYYDLRNSRVPLCTLIGHNKTVSYVKFIDRTSLVSASTDNTLKLWDLSSCTSRVIDTPVMSYTGHMNMKNFVGLSVSDGYIATGSETNEVFVYHKAFPMPALSYKFQATDPLSGQDTDDAAQLISSVCWRGQSSTLIAANSTGNIKILEMV